MKTAALMAYVFHIPRQRTAVNVTPDGVGTNVTSVGFAYKM